MWRMHIAIVTPAPSTPPVAPLWTGLSRVAFFRRVEMKRDPGSGPG